jgi:hypothetical protein
VANVGDLTRAVLWLIDQGVGPCGMVGHSLGGAATLVAPYPPCDIRRHHRVSLNAKHGLDLITPETRQQAANDG